MSSYGTLSLQNLEALLRTSVGDKTSVVDFKAETLLPDGENYMSTMLKVDATIKKTKDSPAEVLKLVAKLLPTAEFQRSRMHAGTIFGKEIFMIEKLSRAYRELEERFNSEDVNTLFPKFYGARMIKDKNDPKRCESDTVLLLENVKVLGFDTMDRKKGLPLDHAKLAMRELARYHALGLALRKHNPELFKEAESYMQGIPFDSDEKEFRQMSEHSLDLICRDPRIAQFESGIRKTVAVEDPMKCFKIDPVEPWVTINHGDFWVNNVMFRHDKNGKVEDVKFVDFQMCTVSSPVTDLTYFLFTSTSPEVMKSHMDELLNLYYERFVEVLKLVKVDTSPFSKSSFREELKTIAITDLGRTLFALKLFTLDMSEEVDFNDIKTSVFLAGANKAYIDRVWNVISKYVENGWL